MESDEQEDVDAPHFVVGSLKPKWLVVEGVVKIEIATGRIEVNPDLPMDEVARKFWDALRAIAPDIPPAKTPER
jgi:hypothetical protein